MKRGLCPPVDADLRVQSAASVAARESAGLRAVHPLRAGWRWIVRLNDRIEDFWIGDLLGGVLLCLIGISAFVAVGVLQ